MGVESQPLPEDEIFAQPEWINLDNIEPTFTEKATKPDGMTGEEFERRYNERKSDLEMNKKFGSKDGKPNFKKMVEEHPTNVPEAWMSNPERDTEFGAHPRTRKEMDRLDQAN